MHNSYQPVVNLAALPCQQAYIDFKKRMYGIPTAGKVSLVVTDIESYSGTGWPVRSAYVFVLDVYPFHVLMLMLTGVDADGPAVSDTVWCSPDGRHAAGDGQGTLTGAGLCLHSMLAAHKPPRLVSLTVISLPVSADACAVVADGIVAVSCCGVCSTTT